jgi:demethylmenaquinone methyltransferase/2-methoxy-6-polyprenyl-1,4-benzoquinol methylase
MNMPKKEKVQEMFDNIAGDYDALNHVMSLDVDKRWRRKALRRLADDSRRLEILDLACGTGDCSIEIAEKIKDCHITAADISEGMLDVMRRKVADKGLSEKITIETGDGENLPFGDGTFDRVMIAFGIRNFEDKDKGLREMLRVLKPGGKLVLLELSLPSNRFMRWLYDLYFLHLMPRIGGKISGDKAAYRYLPASVVKFPPKKEFMNMMAAAGFRNIRHKALTLGICRMYTGEK